MDKQEVLKSIETLAAEHDLSAAEVLGALERGSGTITMKEATDGEVPTKHLTISDILYYVGGAIVFVGIAVMISGSWDVLGSFGRILVTLGASIVAYVVGILLSQQKANYEGVATAFHFIAALVLPIGLYVTLDTFGLSADSAGTQTVISFIAAAVYTASFALHRKNLFLFFMLIFGTWFFYALTEQIAGSTTFFGGDFFLYRTLFVGITYMLLGYYFTQTPHKGMSGWLYGFGSLAFLGSALALGGWKPEQNLFFEILYPGFVFAILFLSVSLKSRAFLVWGATFLMAYIIKITSEYFSEGLGWPLALVLAGLLLITVGYYSVYLNKKYIAAK